MYWTAFNPIGPKAHSNEGWEKLSLQIKLLASDWWLNDWWLYFTLGTDGLTDEQWACLLSLLCNGAADRKLYNLIEAWSFWTIFFLAVQWFN